MLLSLLSTFFFLILLLYAPSALSQYPGLPYLLVGASPRFLLFPLSVEFYFVVNKSSVVYLLTLISRGIAA